MVEYEKAMEDRNVVLFFEGTVQGLGFRVLPTWDAYNRNAEC